MTYPGTSFYKSKLVDANKLFVDMCGFLSWTDYFDGSYLPISVFVCSYLGGLSSFDS